MDSSLFILYWLEVKLYFLLSIKSSISHLAIIQLPQHRSQFQLNQYHQQYIQSILSTQSIGLSYKVQKGVSFVYIVIGFQEGVIISFFIQ